MGAFEVFRYEHKYIVSESAAAAIRSFLRVYMKPDQYMAGKGPFGYSIYSLYFDTPHYTLYRQTMAGVKNRFKLRIRFYDDNPISPAFLEVKRRVTDTIHKLRAVVSKRSVARLLCGGRLTAADLLSPGDAPHRALSEFCDRSEGLGAVGKAFVAYVREAYVSTAADGVRVTLDRQIAGHAYDGDDVLAIPPRKVPIPQRGVVLELKYDGRSPAWMQDMIQSFQLYRTVFPKYVYCVQALQKAQKSGLLARSVTC
jgi:hypothetical protein